VISFLIDLAVIGTVAFCGWRGFKNGLIRGAFGVIALLFSLFLANVAAQAYSSDASGMLMPFVGGMVETSKTEMSDEGIEYQPLAHDHEVDDEDFGVAYSVLRFLGLPEASAVHVAEESLKIEEDEHERAFSDIIANRLSSTLAYVAVFGIAFLLSAIIFAVVGNLVGFVFALPGLKLVDMISGTILGLLKGLIIVYTVAVIIRYFGLIIISTLEETTILRYIVNNNPIAVILGI